MLPFWDGARKVVVKHFLLSKQNILIFWSRAAFLKQFFSAFNFNFSHKVVVLNHINKELSNEDFLCNLELFFVFAVLRNFQRLLYYFSSFLCPGWFFGWNQFFCGISWLFNFVIVTWICFSWRKLSKFWQCFPYIFCFPNLFAFLKNRFFLFFFILNCFIRLVCSAVLLNENN